MGLTGLIGSSNSELGNVQLGAPPASPPSPPPPTAPTMPWPGDDGSTEVLWAYHRRRWLERACFSIDAYHLATDGNPPPPPAGVVSAIAAMDLPRGLKPRGLFTPGMEGAIDPTWMGSPPVENITLDKWVRPWDHVPRRRPPLPTPPLDDPGQAFLRELWPADPAAALPLYPPLGQPLARRPFRPEPLSWQAMDPTALIVVGNLDVRFHQPLAQPARSRPRLLPPQMVLPPDIDGSGGQGEVVLVSEWHPMPTLTVPQLRRRVIDTNVGMVIVPGQTPEHYDQYPLPLLDQPALRRRDWLRLQMVAEDLLLANNFQGPKIVRLIHGMLAGGFWRARY